MDWQCFRAAYERKSLLILDNAGPPRWLLNYYRRRWKSSSGWGTLLFALADQMYPGMLGEDDAP